MKQKAILFLVLFVTLTVGTLYSQNYSIGANAGARGFGMDLKRAFGENLNVGIGFSLFSITVDGGTDKDDYKYSADAKLSSFNLFADWFPFEGSIFRVTGGFVLNLNKSDVVLNPTKTYTVGGDVYGPEQLGNLTAKIKFNPLAPYFGLGIGNPTQSVSNLSFTLDVGTFYQGGAIVELEATKLLKPSATPDQEAQLEENLSWFKWYPVVNFGVNYRF